ncbi:MAG: hypothetical protein ACK4N1_15000 [Pseudorhizobium sp.]
MKHRAEDRPGQSLIPNPGRGAENEVNGALEAPPRLRSFRAERQRAKVSLRINKHAGFEAEAEITNGGLLSIAALVSSILLSTAVLVRVAAREANRKRSRTD